MIIFATSDKGGTGRSVTSCNVAFRRALQGSDVCYLDFDFGSPTAGAIFNLEAVGRGIAGGVGLHSHLTGKIAEPEHLDVWGRSERKGLPSKPIGAGRLTLLPGDEGGGEFPVDEQINRRCRDLFVYLEEEFDLTLVDLSAGRSYASEMVLAATGAPELRDRVSRWLVFHRWTRQHIIAAAGLVFGEQGILHVGVERGHNRRTLEDSVRFVRTAVLETDSPQLAALRPEQAAWLQDCNSDLQDLAGGRGLGRSMMLGSIPLDPVLQWREQIITENDIWNTRIANAETGEAFEALAKRLTDKGAWEGL
jgi:hypothetical protein